MQHFAAFVPQYAGKGRLASFPSIFAFELPKGDIVSTLHKFNLPNRFALVVNQFWRHKNHLVVVNAISQLRRNSIRIPVVMVGLPADYRDPLNQTLSSLLQAIACCDVNDRIKVLGLVNHEDLVNLMRAAAVIIQPSRFEGWSTVVQDSKALGRPLICSDIPVHREQAPNALGFFNWSDAQELADLLAASWPNLGPGPEPPIEERSLGNERAFARHFGQELLQICREAAST
jgi:glycosyltransferase involved in cell wall biosynthesis